MHIPRPKALSCIKQDRLASRQELKAVVNILSHVGMSMDSFFPRNPLKAKVCGREDRQVHTVNNENLAFICDKESGQTRWDVPMQSASEDLRLVLCADQGSPLFTCFQFLAHSGANISLIRDELLPGRNMVFVLPKPEPPRDLDFPTRPQSPGTNCTHIKEELPPAALP